MFSVELFYLNTLDKNKYYRWVLLKHTLVSEGVLDTHFDFLLEDKEFCRTWRLSNIPTLDGPYVDSLYIAPHNLYWLDIKEKVVSGNRGFAKRIKKGIFFGSHPSVENDFVNLSLKWDNDEVNLVIDENGCRIFR